MNKILFFVMIWGVFLVAADKATAQGMVRGQTVYTGCGYTYKSQRARDTQCPAGGGTSKWIGDGVDERTLTRGQTVYTGCGYTYASKQARDTQCPGGVGTSQWIPDEESTPAQPVPTPNANFKPIPRGATVYTGCGYTYKSKSARNTQCGSGGTSMWIGDGVDERTMTRGQTVYTGCGYTYASKQARDTQCPGGVGTSQWIPDESTPSRQPMPDAGFVKCANENERCNFTGRKIVRYGAPGKWIEKTFLDGVNCTNDVFGDPAYGINKQCFIKNGPNEPNPLPQPPKPGPHPNNKPASPLSDAEMNRVMRWIAVQTSALRVPYCYKDSYGRGVGAIPGRVADCPPSYTNNGLTCGRGADTISAPSKVADCPPGYTNTGVSCFVPADTYSKGCTTIFKKYDCRPGYTDNGCFCGRGADSKSLSSATCPGGYHKSDITGRCIKNCPEGYTNTGETCFKTASTLGIDAMTCAPGETKDGPRCYPSGGGCGTGKESDAGLCYPKCKAGFYGVGPMCWQQCPDHHSTSCAAGCATSTGECVSSTFDMASSVVIVAVNVASLGQAAPATRAAKVATSVGKMTKAYKAIKKAVEAAGVVGDAYTIASAVYDEADLFATEFADNFQDMTSPEIAAEIDRRFSPKAAVQVKRQWAFRNLTLNLEADGLATGKNIMSVVGVFDPTGVVDVVNAFTHPVCKPSSPFPDVRPRY